MRQAPHSLNAAEDTAVAVGSMAVEVDFTAAGAALTEVAEASGAGASEEAEDSAAAGVPSADMAAPGGPMAAALVTVPHVRMAEGLAIIGEAVTTLADVLTAVTVAHVLLEATLDPMAGGTPIAVDNLAQGTAGRETVRSTPAAADLRTMRGGRLGRGTRSRTETGTLLAALATRAALPQGAAVSRMGRGQRVEFAIQAPR